MDFENVVKAVKDKNRLIRFGLLAFGVFLCAFNFNLFLLPNNLVIGGMSGVAIIIKKIFNIDPVWFIYISSVFLAIFSLIFLGSEKTLKTMVGMFLYPLFVIFTKPLASAIDIHFGNVILTILVSGVIYGVGNGLIYKTGYTTGGSDVLGQIVEKYIKVSVGKSLFIINIFIILGGGLVFGFTKVLYAVIILYINTNIIDRILLGISDSKLFFIYTKKEQEIKEFITEKMATGVSIIDTEGGYTKKQNKMLMCVVSTVDYYMFKETLREIDPQVFIVINDCYEVMNGVKRHNLPFLSN